MALPPAPDEIEVSIFGPGYGEAIAVHMGQGKWMLVDSCVDSTTHTPASIQYLNTLGLNPADVVKLVVVTHWHDDHICGFANLLAQCSSARLAISLAMNSDQFRRFLAAVQSSPARVTTGFNEIDRVFQQLQSRKAEGLKNQTPMWVVGGRTLFPLESDDLAGVGICSLSPSDKSIRNTLAQFALLLPPTHDLNRRAFSARPNHNSIVLWVAAHGNNILLGADLERHADRECGWTAVVENKVPAGKADVFKVSHHGSSSGHDDAIWSSLLNNDPIAVVTPWARGNLSLPTSEDLARIKASTSRAYCTAPPRLQKTRFKNAVVRKWVAEIARQVLPVRGEPGHVRLRLSMADATPSWNVEMFNGAKPIGEMVASRAEQKKR